ncbi:MAG: BMP family ABC transporter substrate-binding protein [Eubacteriales bacterium]|nr:BMP family ABC transporter substrate-binding protein [Eubacteriales bacterium]
MKKLVSLIMAIAMMLCMVATAETAGIPADQIKVGVVLLHDENVGYDYAHMMGVEGMQEALGLSDEQIIYEYNIAENEDALSAAKRLVAQGCNIIFADSFGHEDYIIEAAYSYPNVQFCHATGYQAASTGLTNMANYFTGIYESRYVSGVVAGLKLAEKYGAETEMKIGYVGAFSYAEVVSGYTAFYLGVRSVCPNVTMEVKYTGSWADQAIEREVALSLIESGCVLVSQHADTTGAASACEEKGVLHVGYNVGMIDTAPNSTLVSASNTWSVYYTHAVDCMIKGQPIPTDWAEGYKLDAVCLTELNENIIAEGTAEKVAEIEAQIKNGELHVFDTSTWTVNGETITSTTEIDGYYGLEYIFTCEDGCSYFAESTLASAPAFAFRIDGITELNEMY